jgi:electron transport complex protein RnfD
MNGSPHSLAIGNSVNAIMIKVLLALIPGIAAHAWFFGPGIWVSLLLCTAFAFMLEVLLLLLRGFPLKPFLTDGSVLVTAWLLALALPTLAPWWIYAVGAIFAVVIAKHLYGGLGQNLFNPAMVAYAVLIVGFPTYMTQWPAPVALALHPVGPWEAFDLVLSGKGSISPDAYTSATVLDTWKTQARLGVPASEIVSHPAFGHVGGFGHEWVALGYLTGGLLLMAARVVTWHIPVAFLGAVALTTGALHLADPVHYAPPLLHLAAGGTMLGAFFIATDPVTAASTPRGKLIYAALAGFLVVVIRVWGNFPDGIAFAILLANVCVPFIDDYTQPRVFGHARRKTGPGDQT